ncbi:DMT family transporter [Dethiosulfovibrio sp. F2B]|uniref:DMT family transporter n=1 Tax=Dethiosulfovibrio faecalis TaxID=2720018 RepID=UPI001F3D0942|nr:EamA family transporter [Dethiosulfovibrio faecalis]MCF4152140.1 DMT family transporter [Dethiosulfovibrio faecalis]
MRLRERSADLVMFLAVFATSTGSIFAKAANAPSLTVAAYRVGLASLVLVPMAFMLRRDEIRSLSSRDWKDTVLSGTALAVHFASWISSLSFISVASCVVLVNTAPLWVAMMAPFLTGERINGKTATAIAVAVSGAVIIGWGDFSSGSEAWKGDLLAVLGAITMAIYLLLGRRVREKVSLLSYVSVCYGTAAILLWTVALIGPYRTWGFSSGTWWAFWGMAIIPQLLGHSAYNWALRWVSPSVVSVVLLGEPVCSSVMALFLFGEPLGLKTIIGGCLILMGVHMAQRARKGL